MGSWGATVNSVTLPNFALARTAANTPVQINSPPKHKEQLIYKHSRYRGTQAFITFTFSNLSQMKF